ncbi:MAG TPA: protein kinase [Gammaproteobacteria bacterium]|nr:protein kinase [Gammaproteobacteria bacterium]
MADLKTALQAYSKGQLKLEVIVQSLDKVLAKNPKLLTQIMAQLGEAFASGLLDAQTFARLKVQAQKSAGVKVSAAEAKAEATVFAGGMPDKTQVLDQTKAEAPAGSGYEKTVVTNTSATADTGFDVTGGSDFETSGPSGPSAPSGGSWPTSTSGSTTGTGVKTPIKQTLADGQIIGPGTILKERFRLMEVLGVGGMGTVYRGVDLLKEEARDRNPFVALKVLNEDFKQHPDSFIALQREASRQQKLAHPNIATVYDFDRTGSTVFLTMELMEGQPLNTYIKKVVKHKNGIPFPAALRIVKGLGAALNYAHERRIVHSDFKPGNCFLLKSGDVKVLDFGIARAVKNPGAGEGEKTLFDPSKLGALTPAYASAEMLDGMDPVPQDDIYALACVAYELLTGRHPFNKMPANQARANKLAPAPIKGLNRRQNKALARGLAFSRDKRSKTIQEFVTQLEDKRSVYQNPFIMVPAALALIAAIGIVPTINYLHRKEVDELTSAMSQSNISPEVMSAKLTELTALNADDQAIVKRNARDPILAYFETQIQKLVSEQRFAEAKALSSQALALFPDSVKSKDIDEQLDERISQKFSDIIRRFNEALKGNKLLADDKDPDNMVNVLADVGKIDPKYALLSDARLPAAYTQAAEDALKGNDIEHANLLVETGEKIGVVKNSLLFQNTGYRIKAAIEKQTLEKTLEDAVGKAAALADFGALRDNVIKLATLNPDSPALAAVAEKLKPLIEAAVPASIASLADWKRVDGLRNDYGLMLNAVNLKPTYQQIAETLKNSLSALPAGDQQTIAQEQQKVIDEGKGKVGSLLASAKLEPAWEAQIQAALLDVESRLPADDAWIKQTHEAIAKLYTDKAAEMLKAQRFAEAGSILDKGEHIAPGTQVITTERQQLAQAEEAAKKAEEEKALKAQIEQQKQTLVTQAKAKDVNAARQTLDALKGMLGADDVFVKQDAPVLLADAYEKLASEKGKAKDYSAALKLAKAGLEVAPGSTALTQAVKAYTVDGNSAELRKLFAGNAALDLNAIQGQIDEIKNVDPQKYAALEPDLISSSLKRYDAVKDRPEESGPLVETLKKLFPGNPDIEKLAAVAPVVSAKYAAIGDLLNAGNLTKALGEFKVALGLPDAAKAEELKAAMDQHANDAELNRLFNAMRDKRTQAETAYDAFRGAFKASKFDEANTQLAKAEAVWKDSGVLARARRELDAAMHPAAPGKETAAPSEEAVTGAPLPPPPPSKQPCTLDLAGYGERKKGSCYEMVTDKARGPIMVVIPAGGDIPKPFAISKYEITIADYNLYCKLTGKCAGINNDDKILPVTGISISDVDGYAKWLTERTGKKYRLPTVKEWSYAADAGGKQPKKDYNCRVELNGQVIKGQSLMDANAGKPNGWGLYNYIGNAQEWATNGAGVVARGGAFKDNFGDCGVSVEKPSDGKGDDETGFRLLQEMSG